MGLDTRRARIMGVENRAEGTRLNVFLFTTLMTFMYNVLTTQCFNQSSLLSAFFGPTTVINRVPTVSSACSGEVKQRPHMKQRVLSADNVGPQRLFDPIPQINRNSYEEIFGKYR